MSETRQSAILARPVRAAQSTVVGVLAAPGAPGFSVPETFARLRRLTPLATWVPIGLGKTGHADISRRVAAALDRYGITPRHLILLGEGLVARSALELVLRGELACGGIVAIDVSCDALPFRIVPTVTAIRLVVHHDGNEEPRSNLVGALRAADLDARIINLDLAAGRNAGAAASATETFVLELVATIGRWMTDGVVDP
jgi:hypothetical protein